MSEKSAAMEATIIANSSHRFSSAADTPASMRVAYAEYLRLPQLKKMWSRRDFPNWRNELVLKPALHALEITFRFVSTVLSDSRNYMNKKEWRLRLEALAMKQIAIIALICERDGEINCDECMISGDAPVVDLSSSGGVLCRNESSTEVWKLAGETTMVNRASEESLLPRLVSWKKSEDTAQKMLSSIELEMNRCPYTLGLGEPNLTGKPNLEYDAVCRPSALQFLKRSPSDQPQILTNNENQTLYSTQQIFECWIQASHMLLERISEEIEAKSTDVASNDCWILERIWKILSEIEDLHMLMDPDDFLQLKTQLSIKESSESEVICFRSEGLKKVTKLSKELKQKVPKILGVEADPRGGPRIQEAAMKLYREKKKIEEIHLLQALQAIEVSVKMFFFGHRQVVACVMGSVEAQGNQVVVMVNQAQKKREKGEAAAISPIFLEPPYFPSLDAAKTFLGAFWEHQYYYSPYPTKNLT